VYRLTRWTPADRDDVLAFVVAIQRGEFGIEITAEDQPDLADVAGFYQAAELPERFPRMAVDSRFYRREVV
jgi:hypothetical protein